MSSENLNLKETKVYVKVITDYKSLEYFIIIKKLIRRKAYLAEFLLRFYFIISYMLGKKNQKTDSLIYDLNNLLLNDNNNYQLYLL